MEGGYLDALSNPQLLKTGTKTLMHNKIYKTKPLFDIFVNEGFSKVFPKSNPSEQVIFS